MDQIKYVVCSFYDYGHYPPEDYTYIAHATEKDIKNDGDNWVGTEDGYCLNCYDNLEEAVKQADYWPISINYDNDFTDEERKIIVKTINDLITNPSFCKQYKRTCHKPISVKELLFVDYVKR